MISASDPTDFPRDYHTLGGGARRFHDNNGGFASSSLDRRHHDSAASRSLEALNGTERQHDAFRDLQKASYPSSPGGGSQGGAAGRQPQPNYWSFKTRTPRVTRLSPPPPALAASAEHLGSSKMAGDLPPAGFNRMNRLRQSLPLARSSSSATVRAPGLVFLQLGEEMRRVHLTHQLSSLDTLRALIVHMFPQRLTMATLRSPSTALLIKDERRKVFYELEDPRDVQDRCVIKIYCKEPVYGGYAPQPLANGELRLSREVVYAPHDSPPPRRLSNPSPQHSSPSRVRLLYGGAANVANVANVAGGRPSSYAGPPPSSSPHHYYSSSAILERRDVKPDHEEGGGARSVVLLRDGGGGLYADPYALAAAGVPNSPYGSLYRRGGGGRGGGAPYSELMGTPYNNDAAYAAALAATELRVAPPPSSPQKTDVYGGRGSPAGRRNLRRDSTSSHLGDSPRGRGLSGGPMTPPDQLCLMAGPGGGGGAGPGGFGLLGNETETRERMEVMEKQIASLTGLLQRVLRGGAESPEKGESASDCSGNEAMTPSEPLALMPPPLCQEDPSSSVVSRLQLQLHLQRLQRSSSVLRSQLQQLRSTQLENRDAVMSLLRETEVELNALMADALRTQEDPLQRQRLLVEEERIRFLRQQEALSQQLTDLEMSVEELQRSSSLSRGLVTQQEVEKKIDELTTLADTLTQLKSEFPGLQSRMRVVLRVEVEAVKFLKEETQRLEVLMLRSSNIRDSLSTLRRRVSEGIWAGPEDPIGQSQRKWEETSRGGDVEPELEGDVPEQDAPPTSRKRIPADVRLAAERDWEQKRASLTRDWEEKRASLTRFSAQDIQRLLEETQAELLKSLPDLDSTGPRTKPAVPPKPHMGPPLATALATPPTATTTTAASASGEQKQPGKVALAAQKLNSLEGVVSHREGVGLQREGAETHRGSGRGGPNLSRAKAPPPPPPRRSFPSLSRPGDVLLATANNLKVNLKLEADAPRPASTPPFITSSANQDDQEDGGEEKIFVDRESSSEFQATVGPRAGGPTVAARLKHLQQGSLERPRSRKQKEDFNKTPPSQQQVFHF